MPAIMRRGVVVAWLWCLAGCVGPSTTGGGATPSITLGTGATSFEQLPASGAQLELISGPQGGWHLNVSARFTGLEPDGLQLSYEVRRVGETTPISFRAVSALTRRSVRETEPGVFDRLGDRAVLNISGPAAVANSDVEVTVTAQASNGAGAADTRTIHVQDQTNELP